jgi:transcriptional regulator with XRE-family HTH domain
MTDRISSTRAKLNTESLATTQVRLKRVREEKGMSQRAVARAAGISQSTYSDLERGDGTGRSLETFARVAKALGVGTDYLLGMKEPEVPKRGRGALTSGLTELESEILHSIRVMRPERRQILASIAKDMADEDARTKRNMALLREIEALDKSGVFDGDRERLYALAAKLGSMRAAVSMLKEGIEGRQESVET